MLSLYAEVGNVSTLALLSSARIFGMEPDLGAGSSHEMVNAPAKAPLYPSTIKYAVSDTPRVIVTALFRWKRQHHRYMRVQQLGR